MGGPEYSVFIIGWKLNKEIIDWFLENNIQYKDKNVKNENEVNNEIDELKNKLKNENENKNSIYENLSYIFNMYYFFDEFNIGELLKSVGLKNNNKDFKYVIYDGHGEFTQDFFITLYSENYNSCISLDKLNTILSDKENIERCQNIISKITNKKFEEEPSIYSMLQYHE